MFCITTSRFVKIKFERNTSVINSRKTQDAKLDYEHRTRRLPGLMHPRSIQNGVLGSKRIPDHWVHYARGVYSFTEPSQIDIRQINTDVRIHIMKMKPNESWKAHQCGSKLKMNSRMKFYDSQLATIRHHRDKTMVGG